MKKYYYLVVTPESLLVSHLSPFDFGNYMAVGTKKNMRGQVIFFEVDPSRIPGLPYDYVEKRVVPYSSGEPKRSVYLSIYRVLERIPLEALRNLYLVSDDGLVLEIAPGPFITGPKTESHLYQQFIPTTTRVASKLTPPEFVQFLTDTQRPVSSPKVLFAELHLNELATNPYAPLNTLPYPNPDHLRDCLIRLNESTDRNTKTVFRMLKGDIAYRTIKEGFFAGEGESFLFYPFPSPEQLEGEYYAWWKSALIPHFFA